MTLRQQMQHDLEFLKQAFPRLQEQLPDGEWITNFLPTDDLGHPADESVRELTGSGSYEIGFQVQAPRVNWLGHEYTLPVWILSLSYEGWKTGENRYILRCVDGSYVDFPTIYAAVEFIGRISHALTPVSVVTEE